MKKFLFLPFILSFLLSAPLYAKVQTAKLSIDIPSGQWKSIRLKNLPENSAIRVVTTSSSLVNVAFVSEINYERYPEIKNFLFQGDINNKLNFSVKIPSTENYYLIFDNISGTSEVKLNTTIYGASALDSQTILHDFPENQKNVLTKNLSQIVSELEKLFIFDTFPINVKVCGKAGVYSSSAGIDICLEFVKKITNTLGNGDKAKNVLLFTIYHEVGHILLRQWEYPFYDNEEVADDFATTLIMLIGERERLGAMTEYFISNPSSDELLAKAFQGDRHPLSIERARNILRWMKDPDRFRKWQTIFVPHMQTSVLEHMKESAPTLVNIDLIEREISLRKHPD